MPAADDVVWIDVLPSMARFGPTLAKDASAASAKAGSTSGSRFSESFKRNLRLGAAIGGAMAVAAGAKFLKNATTQASDLGESLNAVNVTFGKNAEGIKKLGEQAANSVGLSNQEFNQLAVQFSAFAGTIAGKGGDVVATMEDLTTRGADFASVMNLEVNEAMGLFQSGLAGETEPLRRYGIDLSAAAVENHALATGIAEAGDELTEQQKVQARYSLLMKSTAKTQGDFKNTSDSLANSQRILGANWDNIQASVGSKLIPALERLSGWMLSTGLPALQRFGGFFSDRVMPILRDFGGFVTGTIVPALSSFAEWVKRNADVIVPLTAAVLAAGVAIKVVALVTKGWAAAQALMNAVLAANPIGIVVVVLAALAAAIFIAYKRSETFRKIVDAAWAGIQKAVSFAWENVIKPALKALWWYISNVLIPVIKFLWNNVVKPHFKAIGLVIETVWNRVVKPVLKALVDSFKASWDMVKRFSGGVKDAWTAVKNSTRTAVLWVVDKVLWMAEKMLAAMAKAFSWVPGLGEKMKAAHAAIKGLRVAVNREMDLMRDEEIRISFATGRRKSQESSNSGFGPQISGGGGGRPGTGAFGGLTRIHADTRGAMAGVRDIADGASAQAKRIAEALATEWKKNHPVGRMGKAGNVLPGGSYSIGMPYLGYPGHYGADYPAATGTPVFALANGLVTTARSLTTSYGKHVYLGHPGGVQTRYAHLNSILVGSGQQVRAGQQIGTVGSTGNSTGPHLHFEYRRNGSPVNPASLGIFDKGGWLKPGMGGVNLSKQPEPVFTGGQWATLRSLTRSSLVGGGTGGAGAAVRSLSDRDIGRIAAAVESGAYRGTSGVPGMVSGQIEAREARRYRDIQGAL